MQASQKPDPMIDMINLKEILDFLASKGIAPFGDYSDLKELKSQFKSAKISLNSISLISILGLLQTVVQ
jgi:hypothetical protein